MNRNKDAENLDNISKIIRDIKTKREITDFLKELLTESEIKILSKRWQILKMLSEGKTQREISKNLQVSLCKVTRGAKILKNKESILSKHLAKEQNNANN